MKPVARYCRWKSALSACWQIPIGLAAVAVALILVPYFVAIEVVGREGGSWGLLVMGLMPLLIGWLSLTEGVRKAQAAFEKDFWLKAGPEGLSFRLPGPSRAGTLYFTYDVVHRVLAWRDVIEWYPYVMKVNGIPTYRKIIVVTAGGRIDIEGGYFEESVPEIVANIKAASSFKV